MPDNTFIQWNPTNNQEMYFQYSIECIFQEDQIIYWSSFGFCCNNFSRGEGPGWNKKFWLAWEVQVILGGGCIIGIWGPCGLSIGGKDQAGPFPKKG